MPAKKEEQQEFDVMSMERFAEMLKSPEFSQFMMRALEVVEVEPRALASGCKICCSWFGGGRSALPTR